MRKMKKRTFLLPHLLVVKMEDQNLLEGASDHFVDDVRLRWRGEELFFDIFLCGEKVSGVFFSSKTKFDLETKKTQQQIAFSYHNSPYAKSFLRIPASFSGRQMAGPSSAGTPRRPKSAPWRSASAPTCAASPDQKCPRSPASRTTTAPRRPSRALTSGARPRGSPGRT